MNKSDAEMMVAQMAAAFPKTPITGATISVYAGSLLDLDVERAAGVVKKLIATEEWFPTIAKIRHDYAVSILGAPDPSDAYAQALGPRDDRHPLVQEAKRRAGDEADWRETPSGIMRKRFLEDYDSILGTAMRRIVVPYELPPSPPRPEIEGA